MKKYFAFVASFLMAASCFAQNENVYASKSGKIVYEYEMEGITSSYSLTFDDHGAKQIIDIVNPDDNEHVKTIITPQAMFVVNYTDKQVLKIPIEMQNSGMYDAGAGGLDLSELVSEVTGEKQVKTGTEMVAGKNCDIYNYSDAEGNKGKYWIWNGYLLKADFVGEDNTHSFMKVKEINLDANIAASEFEIPSDFELNDMTKMMDQMNQLKQMYGSPDEE
ncbi:MAG: hypothetical protein JEZ09_04090 [Salinivirgaceae bacterium]|nr:hypothetical protein [Salinivirgaceae bacterium]